MKRVARFRPLPPAGELPANFVRGFVATGLLAALQKGAAGTVPDKRTALRHALQGGTALAAGCSAADAWQRRNYSGAVLAVATGAAGVVAIDYLMRKAARSDGEKNGQEEA